MSGRSAQEKVLSILLPDFRSRSWRTASSPTQGALRGLVHLGTQRCVPQPGKPAQFLRLCVKLLRKDRKPLTDYKITVGTGQPTITLRVFPQIDHAIHREFYHSAANATALRRESSGERTEFFPPQARRALVAA